MVKSPSDIPIGTQFLIEKPNSGWLILYKTVFVHLQFLNAHISHLFLAVLESLKAISAEVLTPNFSAIRAL